MRAGGGPEILQDQESERRTGPDVQQMLSKYLLNGSVGGAGCPELGAGRR